MKSLMRPICSNYYKKSGMGGKMTEVKEIRISGFRGIKACLPLQFKRGSSYQSMVIYGRNGTGKSSITDAWEWLQTEKIEHLRREGAGPGSYPHKFAKNGDTFIE